MRIWPLWIFLLQFLLCLLYYNTDFSTWWLQILNHLIQILEKRRRVSTPPSLLPLQLLSLVHSSKSPRLSLDWPWSIMDLFASQSLSPEEVVLWWAKLGHKSNPGVRTEKKPTSLTEIDSGGGVVPQRKLRTLTPKEGRNRRCEGKPHKHALFSPRKMEKHTSYSH